MNWDRIEGKWKQLQGSLKERWGNLTDDDLQYIGGRRDRLIGRLQERYGIMRDEAQTKADEWMKSLRDQDLEAQKVDDRTSTAKP